jgi:hypothetical protein
MEIFISLTWNIIFTEFLQKSQRNNGNIQIKIFYKAGLMNLNYIMIKFLI